MDANIITLFGLSLLNLLLSVERLKDKKLYWAALHLFAFLFSFTAAVIVLIKS